MTHASAVGLAKAGAFAKIAPDMRPVLLFAASLVLAWQAALAVSALAQGAWARAAIPWHERLFASTDDRIRRVLGADAEIVFALRTLPPGTILLSQEVAGRLEDLKPGDLERLAARNGLQQQLAQLLYPQPFLLPTPRPIESTEDLVRRGRNAMLCVLPGDAEPNERKGWQRTRALPELQVWEFRTE